MANAATILNALMCPRANCACRRSAAKGAGKTHCCAHEDADPDLDVSTGRNGDPVFKCFAGCSQLAIMAALTARGLWGEGSGLKLPPVRVGRKTITAEYAYYLGGEHVVTKVRYEPKDFRYRRPTGEWNLGALKVEDLLYGVERLDERPDEDVILVEGEQCADALNELGFLAIGAPTSSGTPSVAALKPLGGRKISIWPDADIAGRKYADGAGKALLAAGAIVHTIDWPDAPDKGDVVDYLAEHDREQLLVLLATAPPFEPAAELAITAEAAQSFACTDLGNAERLTARHGSELRWCDSIGWLAWDGRHWKPSEVQVHQLAAETVRSIYKEALDCADEDRRRKLATWAVQSESSGRINSMIAEARWRDPINVSAAELDADPMLLNVDNGTVDLRSGRLGGHRPEDLITKLAPVDYDPQATSEVWDTFVAQATAGQEGLAEFLQRFAGYCLTGEVREDTLVIFHGPGGGGKSTFTSALQHLLGDYAGTVRIEALVETGSSGGHNEDVAVLAGRRFVLAVEASESDRLREGLVKTLTGGDAISASRKNKPVFHFRPAFKLVLATNFVPRIRAEDTGMWRRLLKVPFLNVPEVVDKSLRPRLQTGKAHQRAILAWAIAGCLTWQKEGLQPPACVKEATAELRNSMDSLAEFFEDICDFSDGNWTASSALRDAYKAWATQRGIPERYQVSPQRLAEGLRQRGCDEGRRGHVNERGWRGVSVFKATTATTATTDLALLPYGLLREKSLKKPVAAVAVVAGGSTSGPIEEPQRTGLEWLMDGNSPSDSGR